MLCRVGVQVRILSSAFAKPETDGHHYFERQTLIAPHSYRTWLMTVLHKAMTPPYFFEVEEGEFFRKSVKSENNHR